MYMWFIAGKTSMVVYYGNETLPKRLVKSGVYLVKRKCSKFNLPLEDESKTKQQFATMWHNLLIDSEGFLGITQ